MPPKKKPAATTSSTAASTAQPTATITASAPTATPSSSSSTTKVIKWYWAGDSTTGTQDTFIEYDADVNDELEEAYQSFLENKKLDRMKVDKERYVDFSSMTQCRYNDPNKQRTVERKEIDPNVPVQLTLPKRVVKKPAAKKGKKRQASDDDSSDDDNSKTSTTSTTSTTATTKKKIKKRKADSDDEDDSSEEDDSDDDNEDYHASWYWAGDSGGGPANGGGHQDIWVKYDLDFAKKLEKAYNDNEPRVKVDSDRFVDIQNMLQRRYDDENKRRNIKREDPVATKPPKKTKKQKDQSTTPNSITTDGSTNANTAPASQSLAIAQVLKCPSTWVDVSMDYKEVDVHPNTPEFDWMSELFIKSIAPSHKGTVTLSPIVFNTLKVTRVVRIQNASLWLRYNHRKEKILQDNHGKCTPVDKIVSNLPSGPDVDKNANECFLFHGLNVSSITGITKFGFDPRFCSLEGMFGAGLYFAENSSKSNQYCHAGACTSSGFKANNCKCTQKDEVCLLVCRVILGESLIENVFRGNNPGDFWHGRRTEPKRPDGVNIYNSVVGESKANHGSKATLQLREYIVYESGQVYPEYKVYYKRVK